MKTEPIGPDVRHDLAASDNFTFSAEAGDKPSARPTGPEESIAHPATGGGSGVKRSFSDLERSPEALELQAKRGSAAYKRCFQIPREERHSGLTGLFSTVHLEDLGSSPARVGGPVQERLPRISSPLSMTKKLFCDLDLAEDVFPARDPENSSFTCGKDLCRNLSLDSDGSVNEMSVLAGDSSASTEASPRSPVAATPLPGDRRPRDSRAFSEPTPQRPTLGSNLFRRGELLSPSVGQSPACVSSSAAALHFLKPRNVVAFRSYCSSINRSNVSSHSVDTMEMSVSLMPAAVTPMQKRFSSSSTLYEVGNDDMTSC